MRLQFLRQDFQSLRGLKHQASREEVIGMVSIFQLRRGAMSQLAMSGKPRQNDASGPKLVQKHHAEATEVVDSDTRSVFRTEGEIMPTIGITDVLDLPRALT